MEITHEATSPTTPFAGLLRALVSFPKKLSTDFSIKNFSDRGHSTANTSKLRKACQRGAEKMVSMTVDTAMLAIETRHLKPKRYFLEKYRDSLMVSHQLSHKRVREILDDDEEDALQYAEATRMKLDILEEDLSERRPEKRRRS
jgi:imidazolonepropionase-like amidohydrolase